MGIFNKIFNSNQSNNVPWVQLTSIEQLDKIQEESKTTPIVIFKHSTRCSISSAALSRFSSAWNDEVGKTPYFLDLIAHREISSAIAEKFNVVHQSPQVIVVKNEKAIFDASHMNINVLDITNA